ncbi:glycosyltransferase family 59 protein [Biscogniauxia marginata]|nr:glycosyltransferase family 59 protein [Biscogniauxia marginata]
MDSILAAFDSSLTPQLLRYALLYAILRLYSGGAQSHPKSLTILSVLVTVTLLGRQWLWFVSEFVPEPYLDEVFHIPQAQVYCEGRYAEWDDKITTPPGLYVLTIVLNRISGLSCLVRDLRLFNVEIISYLTVTAIVCRSRFERLGAEARTEQRYSSYAIGTGLNIALFPVLFFFSGLYYTDIISTFVVLLAYMNHLARAGKETTTFTNDLYTLGIGLLALCMRQTNIFWVVVYVGGLEVIQEIKTLKPVPVETPVFTALSEQINFYAWRYSLGDIHDPLLNDASPVDLVLCILSIGIASLCNLPLVVRRFIWPHGVILATFVAFVAWNGGVVLGDKSNHVATLHLAQMLYIWPLFAFFSAPLFIPKALSLAALFYQTLTARKPTNPPEQPNSRSERKQSAALMLFDRLGSSHSAHAAILLGVTLATAALIVRFNTIIHPFTLADNRHYMFYVFRYSILRAPWVRYALVPVYVFCGWMCWAALQGYSPPTPSTAAASSPGQIRSPFRTSPLSPSPGKRNPLLAPSTTTTTTTSTSTTPAPTSTVLLLLLAASLSLVTAPLVEPRYFILPWVFWRLLVPAPCSSSSSSSSPPTPSPPQTTPTPHPRSGPSPAATTSFLPVLALETAWFALVNAATMYVFITRPFYWRAADGTVSDGGRLQRFVW